MNTNNTTSASYVLTIGGRNILVADSAMQHATSTIAPAPYARIADASPALAVVGAGIMGAYAMRRLFRTTGDIGSTTVAAIQEAGGMTRRRTGDYVRVNQDLLPPTNGWW